MGYEYHSPGQMVPRHPDDVAFIDDQIADFSGDQEQKVSTYIYIYIHINSVNVNKHIDIFSKRCGCWSTAA